jgi:dimethylaniline monooxygenase (N-oxide forming)
MKMSVPSVLIVGAGPSGLAALKEMLEAGLDVLAVDERPFFGGIFAPQSGVTYDNLHLTISNAFMAFSDFPPQDIDKGIKYWSQAEYFDYLARYVKHFQLEHHLQLETVVENANFNREFGKWEVRLTRKSGPDGQGASTKVFDKLIVATGANHKPKLPPEFSLFEGEIIHSSGYHCAEQVRGRKVLVVGMGESGADVAHSAVETADRVTVWGRRYPDCAPRFVQPYLHDAEYDEHQHMAHYHKPNELLESLTITPAVRNLPLGVWSLALQGLVTDVRKKHGPNSAQGLSRAFTARAWEPDFFSSDTSMVPTKSAIVLTAAARKKLDIVIAAEATIQNKTLTFRKAALYGAAGNGAAAEPVEKDSHALDFDVIVSCTGFDLSFDWISFSGNETALDINPRTWFKHCFPKGMGEHLAFVGFARPHSGGIPQCSEMVSRYIAQLYKGNLQLPSDYDKLALADAAAERACFHLTPDYNVLVDYFAYMMSVAKLVGCTPRVLPRLSAPLDAVKYWTFPQWPCFFRSRGIGAKPDSVEAVLSKFGAFDALTPNPLLAMQLLCGVVMPVVNLFSWLMNVLIPQRIFGRALPWLYKWRMSKMHFMYHNSLTLADFKTVFSQWLAVALIIGHLGFSLFANTRSRARRLADRPALDLPRSD